MEFFKSVFRWSLAAWFFAGSLSLAAPAENPTLDGVSLAPLAARLREQLLVVQRPLSVYHWFTARGAKANFSGPLRATAPEGFDYVRRGSQVFWRTRDQNPGENDYGAGLYAAVDPVVTRSFGEDEWVVVEIRLPQGTLLYNATRDNQPTSNLDPESARILEKFHCSSEGPGGLVDPSVTADPRCRKLVRVLLQDILKIDGILYDYHASKLPSCDENSFRSTALILTESRNLKASDVKIFNSHTRDEKERRILLASLFYKADAHDIGAVGSVLFPSEILTSMKPACESGDCPSMCTFCPASGSNQCHTIEFDAQKGLALPNHEKISTAHPPVLFNATSRSQGEPLWPDLDGSDLFPNAEAWVHSNLLGCSPGQLALKGHSEKRP